MKGIWKRVVALFTGCLLMSSLVGTGSAAASDPNLDWPCSLIIKAENDAVKVHEDNFIVDVYFVAYFREGYIFEATVPDFVALQEDLDAGGSGKDYADKLSQKAFLIATNEENSIARPMDSQLLSDNFFGGLDAGMYLVVVRGAEEEFPHIEERVDKDGKTYYASIVKDSENEYVFAPLLVTLPNKNGNVWEYDVTSALKADNYRRAQKKIVTHKEGQNGLSLANAEFKLYCTRVYDEDLPTDTITTYVEGVGYVPLYCVGTYTTDKNGDIEFEPPILDDNTLYAWVETKAPNGYALDTEPHFFNTYGRESDSDYYTTWLNQPSNNHALDTHVRYDNENPNGTGDVTFERTIITNEAGDLCNKIVLRNVSDSQDYYVRVRGFGTEEKSFGEIEARFDEIENWLGPDGNGYWYYTGNDNFHFKPGEELEVFYKPWSWEGTITDKDGKPLSSVGRLVITFDVVPATSDEPVNIFDMDWDPEYSEYNLNSGEDVLVISDGNGGYVKGSDTDMKYSDTAYRVEKCYFDEDSDDFVGFSILNRPSSPSKSKAVVQPGVELPETGGIGTTLFTITGSALIVIALVLLIHRNRRRT